MDDKYIILLGNLVDYGGEFLAIIVIYVVFKIIVNMECFFERRIEKIYVHRSLIWLYILFMLVALGLITTNTNECQLDNLFEIIIIASFIFYRGIGIKKWSILLSLLSKIIIFYAIAYIIISMLDFFTKINSFFNLLVFATNYVDIDTISLESGKHIEAMNINCISQYCVVILFLIIYFIAFKYFKNVISEYIKIQLERYRYRALFMSSINILLYICIVLFLRNKVEYKIYMFFLVLIYSEYTITTVVSLKDEVKILQYKDKAYLESEKNKKDQEMKLKIIKHDLKNHLVIMNNYLKNNNQQGAIEYLDELSEIVENTNLLLFSSNSTVNVLISSKYEEIKKYNIDFNVDISINDDISATCC